MKAVIIYYSYTGNTKKVAGVLAEYIKQKGEVELLELKAQNGKNSFFAQARRAFKHMRDEIETANFDLSAYDLICFGTPVWAFGPAPAMNAYLDKCSGLEEKEVVLFVTYGSGAGKERCLNYMQDILAKKGAKSFRRFSIQQFKVSDKDFILSKAKDIARL